MPPETPRLAYGSDLLREETRKTRRALLGVSTLSITIVEADLFPNQLTLLGISFSQPNKSVFLSILAVLILYFLLGFIIYCISDFLLWRERVYTAVQITIADSFKEGFEKLKPRIEGAYEKANPSYQPSLDASKEDYLNSVKATLKDMSEKVVSASAYQPLARLFKPMTWLRMGFEFAIPLLVGLYGFYCILRVKC